VTSGSHGQGNAAVKKRVRWFHLKAVSPPFSMWWCVLQPGAAGQLRRLVLRGQLRAAKSKRKWLLMFVRRLCLWSLRLIKETKECRELMVQRRIELQVSWLRVMLLAFFAGIPPTAYFRLELYRRRKDSFLRDFLLQNEWQPVSTMARSCEESNALNDKILFSNLMNAAGIPTPPIVARRYGEGFEVSESFHDYQSWFAKPARGHGGRGCARIEKTKDGGYVVRAFTPLRNFVGDLDLQQMELSLDELLKLLASDRFAADLIIQPRLQNASDLAAIAPSGLGVVRLVTGRANSEIFPIAACYCMPSGKRIASQYGVFSQISLETGILSVAADFGISGVRRARHPDTFLLIEGLVIPEWQQCIKVAVDAHLLFRQTAFIGWDVAPTPEGHLVLEGNLNFDVQMLQKWPAVPLLKTPMQTVLRDVSEAR